MNFCSDTWNYGDDIFYWIPYNSTCYEVLQGQSIRATFNEVLIYLYRNEETEAFLKFSLNSMPDHEVLVQDPNFALRWSITIPFSLYEGKIYNNDTIKAVLATDTDDTVEFGPNGKNTIVSHLLGRVHCFPDDITQQINS